MGDFSFLTHLDQKALSRRVEKEKVPQPERRIKQVVTTTKSDDEYSDDASLEEGLDTAIDGENGFVERNWNEEQEYELKTRSGDSIWRRKESTKLPVRSARGDILPLGASESESESLGDSEESDSEEEEVPTKEDVTESSVVTKGLSTTEAKEALAKLAEELLESPEEKVRFVRKTSF